MWLVLQANENRKLFTFQLTMLDFVALTEKTVVPIISLAVQVVFLTANTFGNDPKHPTQLIREVLLLIKQVTTHNDIHLL